jgi:hypothetical protein
VRARSRKRPVSWMIALPETGPIRLHAIVAGDAEPLGQFSAKGDFGPFGRDPPGARSNLPASGHASSTPVIR